MNETAEMGSQIPAIVLFALWWGLLMMLNILFPHIGTDKPAPADGPGKDAAARRPVSGTACQAVRDADPAFDEADFLRGASNAYEAILRAYAEEDRTALAPLLSAEVLEAFEAAMAERRQRREKLYLTFVCLKEARIVACDVNEGRLEISVRFIAEVVSAIRSTAPEPDDGEIVRDDTMRMVETGDLWTFARDPRLRDRNWQLIATDEAA